MKKLLALLSIVLIGFASCDMSTSKVLFDGTNQNDWNSQGEVSIQDSILVLSGVNSSALLKKGNYTNFDLNLDMRTTSGGKGYIGFHTDSKGKGYKVAVNNDRNDAVWWRMTGSLLSVRNLTKSFVKENDWFNMHIRVEGQIIQVKINGETVVEYMEPAEPFRKEPNQLALLSSGSFSLVNNGEGSIQFKNISVEAIESKDFILKPQAEEETNELADDIIRLHQEDFPVLDYHVHLKGGLTNESAAAQSRKLGINYAIAPNCGVGFPIENDEQVWEFLNEMRGQPFILAMQGEGREWVKTFSAEVRNEFDYVFTDALTFTDDKGRRSRIWLAEETWIENEQQYMDMLLNRIIGVLQEPMDVYVNPCFIPEQMVDRYDEFWTEERMNLFIDALVKSGKALEINHRYEIPNQAIIQKAKDAGVKFTFGTNNDLAEFGKLAYCIQMKEACGITAEDMYKPIIKID